MYIPSDNQPNASTPGIGDWDDVVSKPSSGGVAEFAEGEIARAKIVDIRKENSKKFPGTKYLRIFFWAYSKEGNTKPVTWIPWDNSEVLPAVRAIDPLADQKPMTALVGQECCVKITLSRGVTATAILPKTALPGPTLAERGWL